MSEMVSQYFSAKEFACRHCGKLPEMTEHVRLFLEALDTLRERYNGPLVLSSGYRCKDHPIEKAKPGGPGPHSTGCAADILCSGQKAFGVLQDAMIEDLFEGIGVNQRGDHAKRFIHVDISPKRKELSLWSY